MKEAPYGFKRFSCEGRTVNWRRQRGGSDRWVFEINLGENISSSLFNKVVKAIRQSPGFIRHNWATIPNKGIIKFSLKNQEANREKVFARICRVMPSTITNHIAADPEPSAQYRKGKKPRRRKQPMTAGV